jgi:hypothetical protein
MTRQGCGHGWARGDVRSPTWEPSQSELVFPHKRTLLQTTTSPPFDDHAGEEAACGGPGLAWLQVVCGCEAGWTYCQIL